LLAFLLCTTECLLRSQSISLFRKERKAKNRSLSLSNTLTHTYTHTLTKYDRHAGMHAGRRMYRQTDRQFLSAVSQPKKLHANTKT